MSELFKEQGMIIKPTGPFTHSTGYALKEGLIINEGRLFAKLNRLHQVIKNELLVSLNVMES